MRKYYKHKHENLINITKIVSINRLDLKKDFISKAETHDFWEMVYADRESVICTADSQVINLKEGELLFHKPHEFHSLAANGVASPSVYTLSFVSTSEAMKFFENKKLAPNKNFSKYVYSIFVEGERTFALPFCATDKNKMILLDSPSLGGGQIIKNYLEIFLINLLRFYTESESGNETFLPQSRLSSKTVDDVIRMLEENVCNNLTIDEICASAPCGRAYLFKLFKEKTGKSIIEYFIGLKIDRAKRLLLEDRLSIKEIAATLSFNEPNYFTKTFKRVTGITPSTYKKRAKEFLIGGGRV